MIEGSTPKSFSLKRAVLKALLACSALASPPGEEEMPKGQEPKKVGGQAVIEGVMMRGPDRWSVMVRKPQGDIVGRTKSLMSWSSRKPWRYPFVRGLAVLFESLVLGIKALNYSSDVMASSLPDSEKPPKGAPADAASQGVSGIGGDVQAAGLSPEAPREAAEAAAGEALGKGLHPLAIAFSLAMGLGLGLFLFVALPHLLSVWFGTLGGFDESTIQFHVFDGLLKFAIFLLYVWLIGLIPDIARVYAYHGAEHQAIHVYEAGRPLEPSEAKSFPTWHPRCGTAFIFLILAASILFFAIVFPLLSPFTDLAGTPRALAGVGLKLLFTPLLASLAYEVTRLASRPGSGLIWRAMVWPGLILQRLTTRRPDDSMLEVAFKSLESALPEKPRSEAL